MKNWKEEVLAWTTVIVIFAVAVYGAFQFINAY